MSKPADSQLLLNDLLNAGVATEFNALAGGFVVSPDPCDATTYHGFLGIENSAVQEITSRMDFLLAQKQLAFPGNLNPTAANGQYRTKPGIPILINLAPLTDDPNKNFLHYALTHATSSRGGALWRFGRIVIYAPPAGGSNLTDGFVYVVSDGKGGKDIGVVSIRVN